MGGRKKWYRKKRKEKKEIGLKAKNMKGVLKKKERKEQEKDIERRINRSGKYERRSWNKRKKENKKGI